ncbi:IS3 family transposase [Acidithrix sp. C25]|uniref:IS3 family transposase n=1 Tax=Acidithrix sp. C25 TaxID=1671482 RepID=UPI001BD13BBA|nr:IS3 family transposase [Acidithrix sp. C25]
MEKSLDEEITQFLRTFVLEHKAQGYKRAYRYVIDKGYHVNIKKVRSLWRQAGLKVPYKKKRKSPVGHGQAMGYNVPLEKHVSWALDFQFDQTTDTRTIKILNIIDEHTYQVS